MTNQLNLYHIFYTAAQCGSITNAAQKLYISQPAVSKAISRLEASFPGPLLNRSSRGITLTPDGEILYRRLDAAFRAIRQGEELILQNEALGVGQLSIGVSATLCKYILLPYLERFLRKNPHVQLSISCQSTYETISALEDGRLDIGLVGKPERLGNSLTFQPLRTVSDIFVSTEDYLSGLRRRCEQNRLFSQATLLLLDKNNITRQYVDRYLILQGISGEQQIEVTTMDLLIDFAKIGLGAACVIKEFVERELKDGSLVIFPTAEPIPSREIGFSMSGSRPLTPAMRKFLAEIQDPE